MLVMISPAIDEVVAMGQFRLAARREGQPLRRTSWIGGTPAGERSEAMESVATARWRRRSTTSQILAAMELTGVPWNLVASVAIGVWVMVSPAMQAVGGAAADSKHLSGALVVTFAVIAFGQVARPARLLNVPMGLWIAAAPWLPSGAADLSRWMDATAGVALVALSLRRGRIDEQFDGWNRFLI